MMNKQKIISLTLMGAISLGSCMPAMAMQASDAPVGGSSSQNKSEEGNIATLKARYEEARKAYHQASNLFASVFVEAREEAERKCEQAKAECMKKYEVLEGVLIKEERKLERAYEEAEKEVEVRKQVFEEAKRGEWKRCIIACKSAKEIYEKAKITLETEEEKFRIERSKAHDKAELKCSKEKLAEDAAWIAREEAQEALDEALAVEAARAAQAAEIE